MDEENQINDKLKIMKFLFLPCGLKRTPFFELKCFKKHVHVYFLEMSISALYLDRTRE